MFINFSAVAAMLPIMAKLSAILKSECVNTWSFCSYWKESEGDNDSAIKEHHLFCNYSSGFDDFCILASNNNDFKVTLMESLFNGILFIDFNLVACDFVKFD